MSLRTLWAIEIERMTPSERTNTTRFSPYRVTPDGSLHLPFDGIRSDGPQAWPVGRAPGWTTPTLTAEQEYGFWRPLGSEFYFDPQHATPFTVHVRPEDISRLNSIGSAELRDLVRRGYAFPFCGRVFVLPDWEEFIMNSMQYHVDGMDRLAVFVGYRGTSKQYKEKLTPGLYRKHTGSSKSKQTWVLQSRVAGNVLKQRFLENRNKPLTEIESIGILQHHAIIGPTDMLDFSHDLSVAKWFALNECHNGTYRQKRFDDPNDDRAGVGNTSCVYIVAARVIPLDVEDAKQTAHGVTFELWENFGLQPMTPQAAVSAWNIAPIWSERPQRQRAFGLRGIGPGDVDMHGAVLSVTEHLFHPESHANGWDCIGGPEFTLNNQRFTFDENSSHLAEYLFPEKPKWLTDAFGEIRRVLDLV